MSTLGKAALAYAARGWAVLPVEPRGKRPLGSLVPHGVKDATTDPTVIRGWWKRHPDANVGVATGAASGFDALDVDGEEGAATLAAWERVHASLPSTPGALTGGGGRHELFAYVAGLRNAVGFAPGVDVRTEGGYIVVPPSIHPSGRTYAWEVTRDPADVPLASWPSWLVALIATPPERSRATSHPNTSADAGDAIPEGRRNAKLASLAGTMRRRGMSEAAIRAALLAENVARCRPPLEEDEVRGIASSVAKYVPEATATAPSAGGGGEGVGGTASSREPHLTADLVLDAAGFADLGDGVPASRLEAILRNLGDATSGVDPLRRAVLRSEAAKRLKGAGVASPTSLIDAALGVTAGGSGPIPVDDGKQGHALELPDPEPWGEPVRGGELLDAIEETFRRYAVLPAFAPVALTLWVAHTYSWKAAADFCPRLAITGPTKRCGKTRVLEILAGLVARALPTANVTAAAVFRAVELLGPTLLVDEGDTFLADSEALRGLLNAGQRRGGRVLRAVGEDFEPRTFSVFGPVAIAAIGELPDTVRDRSILIPMRRRANAETVARMRVRSFIEETAPLRRKLARWTFDNEAAIVGAQPASPDGLDDRAADGWEPLLAIADAVGGPWPERAREAAVALSAGRVEADGSTGVLLLRDIRALFGVRQLDRLPSDEIAKALGAMDERPWSEWGEARRPITPYGIARLLKPFGVLPRSIRLPDGHTPKGYLREDFEDAWGRYVMGATLPARNTATAQAESDLRGGGTPATPNGCGGRGVDPEPASPALRGGVAGAEPRTPPTCAACGSLDGWLARHGGGRRCRRCHPPGPGAEAP